jgi:hypothetical protein
MKQKVIIFILAFFAGVLCWRFYVQLTDTRIAWNIGKADAMNALGEEIKTNGVAMLDYGAGRIVICEDKASLEKQAEPVAATEKKAVK